MVVQSVVSCKPAPKQDAPKPVFLMETEAAAFLGLSRPTLAGWRCKGVGPRYHRFGRAIRYAQSDLLDYIQNSVQQTIEAGKAE